MQEHKITTDEYNLELKDGILFIIYKGHITYKMAKEVVENRLQIANGKRLPILVKGTGANRVNNIDKEARDFLSSSAGLQGVKAGAIVSSSVFESFLGNFFIKVSRPEIPSKLFTNEQEALKWLKYYINE